MKGLRGFFFVPPNPEGRHFENAFHLRFHRTSELCLGEASIRIESRRELLRVEARSFGAFRDFPDFFSSLQIQMEGILSFLPLNPNHPSIRKIRKADLFCPKNDSRFDCFETPKYFLDSS